MEKRRLRQLLDGIQQARVAVIGDYCLDAYWIIDPSLARVSHETGKNTHPVREQAYSLGGAGNIVSNLAALGAGRIHAMGVVCRDLFGWEMSRLLGSTGADTVGMIEQQGEWSTPVYGKPHVEGAEQERIDFGVCNRLHPETGVRMVRALEAVLSSVHAVVVNQQLIRGIYSPETIQGINRCVEAHPEKFFIVDSRDRSHGFRGVIFRMNAHEAARVCGESFPVEELVPLEDAVRFARKIEGDGGKPAFISLGAKGSLVCEKGRVEIVPGVPMFEEIDPVGAGDAAASALACALSAGASPLEAAELANLAAAGTVQKLRSTGTATPEEILQLFHRAGEGTETRVTGGA